MDENINLDMNKIATEMMALIPYLGLDYINKLPPKLLDIIAEKADMDNIPNVDINLSVDENPNISKETRAFLTALKLKYWCDTDDEKNEILKTIVENEKKKKEN